MNDITRRQVLLLDSTFTKTTAVADTTSATGRAYSARYAGLIAFHGDSTLFVDPASVSVLILDSNGRLGRVMAVPRPQETVYLVGGPHGTPAFDLSGRLVYRGLARPRPSSGPADVAFQIPVQPDSAPIVRVDLVTRNLDTMAVYKVSRTDTKIGRDAQGGMTVLITVNPMQTVDDWAMLSDGTVAVVRGIDYHVEFIAPTGVRTSAPKVPFNWQRMTDSSKAAVHDSAQVSAEKELALATAQVTTAGSTRGRAPRGPSFVIAPASSFPDYRPAFAAGAARGDMEGNLWVRTSNFVDGGPVYDVINRAGRLIDRVKIPSGRVLAGFGPASTVYMGVLEGTGARLEEARIR